MISIICLRITGAKLRSNIEIFLGSVNGHPIFFLIKINSQFHTEIRLNKLSIFSRKIYFNIIMTSYKSQKVIVVEYLF